MGDISEIRGLVVVGCFLFMSAFLIAGIYGSFGYTTEGNRELTIPEYFEGLDLGSFTATYNGSVPQVSLYEKYWSLGGYDWVLSVWPPEEICLGVKRYWWIFWIGTDWLHFKNDAGINRDDTLTNAELDADYDVTKGQIKYQCFLPADPKISCTFYFGFNVTKYDLPSQAWGNGTSANSDLKYLQGMGLEQISTTMNAWNIIGSILFFQMPNVHFIINAILAVPIWIAVAYISFILILRAIGAIFGGGA